MSTQRWAKKRPTAAQQRATARENALEQCRHGQHTTTPTFRPGETVCTTCGRVVYCPACLSESHLQPLLVHAYPLLCTSHQEVEVQA